MEEINQQRQERPRYLSTDQPDTQSRSLLSRSRVNRAVEAARRVGGGLIVAALNVGGLRSGAGAPTDASGMRRRQVCEQGYTVVVHAWVGQIVTFFATAPPAAPWAP